MTGLRVRECQARSWASILGGLIVQVPTTHLLLSQVLDMHNRMSSVRHVVSVWILFPYGFSWARARLAAALAILASIHAVASVIGLCMRMTML